MILEQKGMFVVDAGLEAASLRTKNIRTNLRTTVSNRIMAADPFPNAPILDMRKRHYNG